MLEIGDKLPEFSLENQDGEAITNIDFIGKKLVVFFYPKASTPGCTKEACNIRDNKNLFIKNGFNVIGVSADSVKRQKNFHSKNELNYDLLSDENKELISKFGVWQEKKMMGKTYFGIVRTTFVIDEKGAIIDIIKKVKTKEHTSQIIK